MRLSSFVVASAPTSTFRASAFFAPAAAASFTPTFTSSLVSTVVVGSNLNPVLRGLRPRFVLPKLSRGVSSWTSPMASTTTSVSEPVPPTGATEKNVEILGSVRQQLANLMKESLRATVPELSEEEPVVSACNNAKHGDYQCNNAMGIFSKIKGKSTTYKNPNSIGQAIAKNIPESTFVEKTSIAGPGFVNIVLRTDWIENRIYQMLVNGVGTWAPVLPVTKAVVDFSSPNIAKEMHVGHLRSTIIGDSLARMLEFCHVDVLRRNHVGDWGTQFGMLIEYLFEQFPNWEDIGDQAIGDLQAFYKAAKLKFDDDADFKAKAQQAVVSLQGGDEQYRAAWQKICDISRREFDQVYKRLRVTLEEKGESFYNPYIPDVVQQLREKNLIEESEGAQVIKVDGFEIPLIVIKRDGGFNYATTDLTAFWYRKNVEKAEWIIYVTDVGQAQHFDMVFKALKLAGWIPEEGQLPKAKHIGFGLVLGADGKRFRTRSSEVVRLVDLLDEAKNRSKDELVNRGKDKEWSAEELEAASEALGYGAVKYADLKNNRLTNYTFDFEQMLDVRGNTAVYLLYTHARICSILRNSKKDIEELKKSNSLALTHPSERQLGLHLVRFAEVVEDSVTNFLPNALCEYLYSLAGMYTEFYTNCKVIESEEETSRLLLCEATVVVMRACFSLLGITPLYRL
ncbi:arginyl-tRNA synthetase [Marchantia polymorpha subsp. ruderalis]|uniref:arginine--tRNA ligase n=2 Tax=Marchantia polymorpha TaxID=3197 RepID=A0A176W4C6_MARPO|nr:hypothetical protein AXG93_3459s1170 [Marchantia polymorpha subsp. ruderalis]PTQ36161.1 hypothetical protein MARPO_0066s0109 [Marchantia polymorpha]BBN07023.1 hypothetical protein Mp_4g00320 [Marchantia polymorpha subsp. ruderalis]|eukprot:PTQ36161.1 hypothetical protein MARPO_0066s0109 [Marchantia polymorpha]